jgi:hypothetical protein
MSKVKTGPWTTGENDNLTKWTAEGLPTSQIAYRLGRSLRSVTSHLWAVRKNEKVAADSPREDYWRKQAEEAQRKLRSRTHDDTAVDVLVEKIIELAPTSYSPLPPGPVLRPSNGGRPQSAVLMFSDTHIGQVIHRDQMLDLGSYNFELFLRRLARLERSVFSILNDHTTTEVPEIVIAMLGDMIHGNLAHAVEAGQVNTLFTQFYAAGHAIAQFFRNLSSIAPLRIETAVGNHPRWGTQRKMPTENRYSNLDQFLYAYVQALLRDVPTVHFNLTKQPFALFDVQGHHFYAGHGDHMRGGDKILGVPNHAIGRNLSTTAQTFSAAGKELPNYYLFGHFHRPITLPHASGAVLINGGFPGLDGFGLMEAFNSSHPLQRFFLVHPKFGKSASYDLRLDLGDVQPHSYKLPEGFAAL